MIGRSLVLLVCRLPFQLESVSRRRVRSGTSVSHVQCGEPIQSVDEGQTADGQSPIFIILLGILVSASNLTASSWKYEPTGQTIETLSSDTAVTLDNPSGKTLAKRGDYEVTQRYVTIEAKQPSTGEIQQVKVLIREPKDAGNNRPGVVFMHGAGYGTCDNSFGDMATDLSSAGFVTAVLDKPVWSTNDATRDYPGSAAIYDQVINMLRDLDNVDASNVGIYATSEMAHGFPHICLGEILMWRSKCC